MPLISVYLQQATDVADHVLYGVVNAVSGSVVTVNNTPSTNNWGGSITNATGPFTGAYDNTVSPVVSKVVRRYTGVDWNTRKDKQRPYAVAANVGTVIAVSNGGNSFTSSGISGWAVGDVWAIDYHSPYSFGKYADSDKYLVAYTADENSSTTAAGTSPDTSATEPNLPRDHMRPMFFSTEPKTGAKDEEGRVVAWQVGKFSKNGEQDIDPLTTKWELRCDTLGRNYSNSAIPLPMPSMGRGDQYFNMLLDIGMRQETINMSGTLVDRGTPSATNPRLQTLFDIVRTQHSSTMDLNDEDQGGGENKNNPSNSLAYLRLTIGSGYEPSDYQESTGVVAGAPPPQTPTYNLNTNLIVRDRNYPPGGPHTPATLGTQRTEKAYRGLITQFSANLMGGKPDIWTWQMTFNVVKNEHDWTFGTV